MTSQMQNGKIVFYFTILHSVKKAVSLTYKNLPLLPDDLLHPDLSILLDLYNI